MLKPLVIALTLAAIATPAAAQSVYGSGGGPCSNWTANLKKRWPHLADTDWLMGYLSGVNTARGPGARLMMSGTVADVTGFVTRYCAANPQRPIFEAADALVAELTQAQR